ncbi:hypothetical protein [Erythrobacter oryzae]|uniref:hypothetical protein n=1 Tax=Erythrobacter oryzae TaxID=3019556 RepID=UPI002554F031|nr:hypothetical protein [Erythrobacter sp. COR-2]
MLLRTLKPALAAALAAFAAAPAMAQDSTPADFARAVASLSARLGTIETGPEIATTDQAANAADLAVIERALDVLGTPAFPVDGFATFESVCEAVNRLSVRHGLDGVSAMARPPGSPPPTPAELQVLTAKVVALQSRNAARYPDAITVLAGGGMRCMVKHFPAITAFLAELPEAELTPARLKGADGMRRGGTQALLGFMIVLREPATTPANRARVIAYVAEVAAPLAGVLTPQMRADLAAKLEALPPTQDAGVLETTQLLKTALADTGCEGLCRY